MSQKVGAKVPPTRPVAGGNEGMNFPLSEIISWILEPLASTIKDSSEVISGEGLRSRMDRVNVTNKDKVRTLNWKESYPGMVESQDPPKLCECGPGECDLVEYDSEDQFSLEGGGGEIVISRKKESKRE